MEKAEYIVFAKLYHEAYKKCFKQQLQQPISETESKLFYNQILDQTGLTIGWRSLKNYSLFVLNYDNDRPENPSIATLDTLARYVLKAPYTNEVARKNDEEHHPYWFLYKGRLLESTGIKKSRKKQFPVIALLAAALLIMGLVVYLWHREPISFIDNFDELDQQHLQSEGWFVLDKDNSYWNKRNSHPRALTLFTLEGDNWPDSTITPAIKNLLIRRLPQGCVSIELQMENFIPAGEWQQAGILLLADSNLNSPSIRISLAYNDFFGGNRLPREVILQAISSPGNSGKPEEFIHYKVLTPDSAVKNPVLFGNLKHTALRIEKQGHHYRFLYAGGFTASEAFKELATKDLIIEPQYVALFALKGRVKQTQIVPVVIKRFMLQTIPCQ